MTPSATGPRLRVGVLASGAGTNLQAILDVLHGELVDVVAVASDVADAPALARARGAGIPTAIFADVEYPDRLQRDRAMADWLVAADVELIVLAGYMRLLSAAFLERFPDRVINVHPSLLPAFPGLHAIEQAIAYGVRVFGVTVHLVDAGVDSGPVILQRAIELPDARDPETVLAALRPLEHELLPRAIELFARGAISRDARDPRRVLIG